MLERLGLEGQRVGLGPVLVLRRRRPVLGAHLGYAHQLVQVEHAKAAVQVLGVDVAVDHVVPKSGTGIKIDDRVLIAPHGCAMTWNRRHTPHASRPTPHLAGNLPKTGWVQ